MRGRKPKPKRQKRLENNPGKRAIKEDQVPPGRPSCPEWLDGEAEAFFNKTADQLADLGIISEIDQTMLATLAISWQEVVELTKLVSENGRTYRHGDLVKSHPAERMLVNALGVFRSLASEFGLSPASRARLDIEIPEEPTTLDLFLAGEDISTNKKGS